jgi:hypothetical protein
VNGSSPPVIADEDFAAHYEQLRGDALGTTTGHSVGLALFLRHGMVAWVNARSSATPLTARAPVPAASPIPLPADVRCQTAIILAGIILNC